MVDTYIDLVLADQHPVSIRALAGGKGLPGLAIELRTTPGNFLLGSRRTDEEGFTKFPRGGEGLYFVTSAGNESVWPQYQYIEVGKSKTNELTFHRRGSLDLELLDDAGEPLASTEFWVYHEQLEYTVHETVDDGDWESSTGGLRTDAAGRVLLSGIPEGRYRVFLPGATKSWKLGVLAGETTFEVLTPLQD